jgi:hypothetical protein
VAAEGPRENKMKFVLIGVMLAAGAWLALQTPTGRAYLLQASAAGRNLADNIVGDMAR